MKREGMLMEGAPEMKGSMLHIDALIATAREFYQRGWMWGTSGNLSARLSTTPEVIAITGSGASKGSLGLEDIVVLPEEHRTALGLVRARALPSSETAIHQAVYRNVAGAGAVLHVHTVASTLVMAPIPAFLPGRGKKKADRERSALRYIDVFGLEMLKGWGIGWENGELRALIPVLPNQASMADLAAAFSTLLAAKPQVPVVFVEGHGMTVWGASLEEARDRLEIAEFICQVLCGRQHAGP